MDILDETVGCCNWQKEYYECKGNLYCRVGINTENGWIWKSDCGVESNQEAEKGEASDAFKRACVCWGIGRSLYTSPKIRIKCPDNYYYKTENGEKLTMTFYVKYIRYDGQRIVELAIADRFDNIVFNWNINGTATIQPAKTEVKPSSNREYFRHFCNQLYVTLDKSGQDELREFFDYWENKVDNWKGKFDPQRLWEQRPKKAVAA